VTSKGRLQILHLTSAHPPHDTRILHKECRALAEAGYDVTLVAPSARDETVGDVRIVGVAPARSRPERMTAGAWRVYRAARRLHADLYHLHDPELLPWGLALKTATGKPVIYDAHEYVGMDVSNKEWLRAAAAPLGWLSDRVEKAIARRLNGIVTVNPHMAELFRRVNPRVAVVANYPPRPGEIIPDVAPEADSIIYVGGIGEIRGYVLLLKAMELLRARRPRAVCRILGTLDPIRLPPAIAALTKDEIRAGGVEFRATVPFAEVFGQISAHAIGWLTWRRCAANLYGTPTKLLEYMAAGVPVVVSDLPFVARIVRDADCGIVVPSESPKAHADALAFLLGAPGEARRMGANGRQAVVQGLNWETQRDALLAFYDRLLQPLAAEHRSLGADLA
jgi:glycosyltransferase involved in cell wall biosynthesis